MPQNSTRCWYFAWHREVAHDQRPDEDVVDAEALLDQVAGDVLAGRRPAEPPQHDQGEADADRDPHRRLDGRLPRADGVRLAVHHQQVDQQQGDDQRQQDAPLPQVDVEIDEVALHPFGGEQRSHRWTRVRMSSRASRTLLRATGPSLRVGGRADDRLRGGQTGDRDAERRAAHVVEAGVEEQGDRLGVAAVLAAHAELERRLGLPAPAGRRCAPARRHRRRRSSRTGCA